ncbi:MAG TPA: hypothetical protein ENI11_00510 [Actinobacteria bacterium]|nr:hypothetical protein [Actinomycetota bacterium]
MPKTSFKKRKSENQKNHRQDAKTEIETTERSFKSHVLVILVVAILLAFIAIQGVNFDRPFYAANDDDNTAYGLAAHNLARFGFINLKFGMSTKYFDSDQDNVPGSFYTNHPQWFVVPAALSYKLFGISEVTTRLPSIIFSLLSIIAFYFTISIVYKDKTVALFATAAYALFPGFLFYGSSLSEKAFIVFLSTFAILSFFLLQTREEKYMKAVFIAMVFFGGLMGWHFYFAAAGLWLYALLRKDVKYRKFLLISTPLVSILTVLINFLHFYILNGIAFLSIFDQFKMRSGRLPLDVWAGRYGHWLSTSFTWPAVLVAAGFLVYVIYMAISKREFNLGLVYFTQPFLVILVFQQWSMHAFGSIYWVQFIALALGLTLSKLVNLRPRQLQVVGSILAILLIGLCFKYGYDGFTQYNYKSGILQPNDIELLKVISEQTPQSTSVALGSNTIGFSYRTVVEWYLLRKVTYDVTNDKVSLLLLFNPGFGSTYRTQIAEAEENGFTLVRQASYFWLYQRAPANPNSQ